MYTACIPVPVSKIKLKGLFMSKEDQYQVKNVKEHVLRALPEKRHIRLQQKA